MKRGVTGRKRYIHRISIRRVLVSSSSRRMSTSNSDQGNKAILSTQTMKDSIEQHPDMLKVVFFFRKNRCSTDLRGSNFPNSHIRTSKE